MLARLARWCFEHRKKVVAGWLLALVAGLAIAASAGSAFNSNFSLSHTDSQAAVDLLKQNFPSASGEGDQIVIEATHGTVRSAEVRGRVTTALTEVAGLPGVAAVASPYSQEGAAQISRTGTVAFATVTWDKTAAQVSKTDAKNLIRAAESADSADVHISLGGQSISNEESSGVGFSVGVGFIAALVVLLVVFGGAIFSSLMPLTTAIIALAIGASVIELLSHIMDVPSVATDLAILIGLGVGVDYGLFIISRHRSAVKEGASYADAAALAVNTSGRTVLFAGITVCIALLGQFALGVSFLYGLSISSAIAVALTMATSLTFLPAMLGFLGPKVLSRRERAAMASNGAVSEGGGIWHRWSSLVERRRMLAAGGALAVVVLIALPIFGLRLGSSDAATDPASTTTHQAYEALARGFGPGFNGPLEIVGSVGSSADAAAFEKLLTTAAHTSGVATVTQATTSPNGKVALATLYPTTGPSAKQTVTVVDTIRHELIPAAEQGTTLQAHVGGVAATNIDFSHVLTDKLPLFIAVVVLLAFLLLTAVFRSLLIPLVASIMNLLSVGAAFGSLNAVFNWGWGSSILNSGTGPIDAFIPVLMFSVLFGLSMDYEVYLVSRIQEEWRRLHHGEDPSIVGIRGRGLRRNHQAVTTGQAKSQPIIAGAALIMILVFGSFLLGGQRALQEFGFGLGFSVLVDAFVIRSFLVPAIMHMTGPATWWMPAWLDRILPNLSVEVDEAAPSEPAELEPVV